MASPQLTPAQPAPGGPPQGAPGAGAGASGSPGGGDNGSVAQRLSRLSLDARSIAGDDPSTAPMMREVENQVQKATMQMIQKRAQAQQSSPQI